MPVPGPCGDDNTAQEGCQYIIHCSCAEWMKANLDEAGIASDAPDKGLMGNLQTVDDTLEGRGPVRGTPGLGVRSADARPKPLQPVPEGPHVLLTLLPAAQLSHLYGAQYQLHSANLWLAPRLWVFKPGTLGYDIIDDSPAVLPQVQNS